MAAVRLATDYLTGPSGVVDLVLECSFGASGAVTLTTEDADGVQASYGIQSITKESTAGQYTIVFGNATQTYKFQRCLGIFPVFNSSTTAPAAPVVTILTDAVKASGSLTVQCWDLETPAATNPASGETLSMTIRLKNNMTNP